MEFLLNFANIVINFYGFFCDSATNVYQHMKCKAFEHKLIYYATYDLKTCRYTLIHDYDNFLSVFYFYITNYLIKFNYAGVSYLDLELLLKVEDMLIITSYVLNGKEYHNIFDSETYLKPRTKINKEYIYAYTDKKEDLTHQLNKFKNILYLALTAQHVANIMFGYTKKILEEKVEHIRYMSDDTFIEQVLT